jgi:hypothetical protein
MMIDRRTFVAGAVVAVVARPSDSMALPSTPPSGRTTPVTFVVDGWSAQTDDKTSDQLWIRIDRGWRASWR